MLKSQQEELTIYSDLEVLVKDRTEELTLTNEKLEKRNYLRKYVENMAQEKERLAVTLRSIGDGVISMDQTATSFLSTRSPSA